MKFTRCARCGTPTNGAVYHYRSSQPLCPKCRDVPDEAEVEQRERRLVDGAAELADLMAQAMRPVVE